MKPKKPTPADPSIRILKIATARSLSGRSQVTYHVGCRADSEVLFRIYETSGNGAHSAEWISASALNKHLRTATFVRSGALHPLFTRRSSNNPGFLLAVMLAEKLVVRSRQKARAYEKTPGAEFIAEVKSLMASDVNLSPDESVEAPGKKPGKGVKQVAKPAAVAAPAAAPLPPIKTAAASARKQANRQAKSSSSKAA